VKRFGVLLALLVLFSSLVVATSISENFNAFSVTLTYNDNHIATGSANGWLFYSYSANPYTDSGDTVTLVGSWNSTFQAFKVHLDAKSANEGVLLVWNGSVGESELLFEVQSKTNGNDQAVGVGAVVETDKGTFIVLHYASWGSYSDGASTRANTISGLSNFGTLYKYADLSNPEGKWVNITVSAVEELKQAGASFNTVYSVKPALYVYEGFNGESDDYYFKVDVRKYNVQLSLKDALTGSPLNGVTVKDGSTTLGTFNDTGTVELTKGQHTLTFEKQGYWSVTKTIDVQSDTSVSIEMYPSSAAFKLENFPTDISIPENTIYTLTFTLSPIQSSATYNTYLSLSGLSDVLEVRKDGSLVSPENGKYYLGDISGPTQVSIKFKAGSVGTHGFTISIESHDAIMSKTYTTTKQVTYTVEPLPFSVQMPSEWQVGENSLRISESSGQSYLITAVLKDSSGNEVWSASHAFSPYEAYTFNVKVPNEGSYTLELQFNGKTAVYSIQVNPAITLKTKTLTVSKGGEGTIVLHFKNPSSDVQYYTIKVSGGFLPAEINQSISVAPLTEKDVSIAFAVPDNLQYDAYELNVQVLQGNATVFQNKVAVSISDSSGFTLFGGSSSGGKTLLYVLAGLLALGGLVWALRRKRRR